MPLILIVFVCYAPLHISHFSIIFLMFVMFVISLGIILMFLSRRVPEIILTQIITVLHPFSRARVPHATQSPHRGRHQLHQCRWRASRALADTYPKVDGTVEWKLLSFNCPEKTWGQPTDVTLKPSAKHFLLIQVLVVKNQSFLEQEGIPIKDALIHASRFHAKHVILDDIWRLFLVLGMSCRWRQEFSQVNDAVGF